MKEKVIEALGESVRGMRLRELAAYIGVNRFKLIDVLDELRKEGIIDGRSNEDHANGEYYIIWYLVG